MGSCSRSRHKADELKERRRASAAVGSFSRCVSSPDVVDWLERFILNSVRLHSKDSQQEMSCHSHGGTVTFLEFDSNHCPSSSSNNDDKNNCETSLNTSCDCLKVSQLQNITHFFKLQWSDWSRTHSSSSINVFLS